MRVEQCQHAPCINDDKHYACMHPVNTTCACNASCAPWPFSHTLAFTRQAEGGQPPQPSTL